VVLFGRGTHVLEFKENVNDVCDLFPSGALKVRYFGRLY